VPEESRLLDELANDEPVLWIRYGSGYGPSSLHRRAPGAARTRCGLRVPLLPPEVTKPEGEVQSGADVHLPDWEGLACAHCYPPSERPARASRARWTQVDRERALRIGTHFAAEFEAGATEIWQDGRGSILVRQPDRWQLRRHAPGSSPHVDTWELLDGRRPRLLPPSAWANRVLSGRAS
jgi:hypothetical protein